MNKRNLPLKLPFSNLSHNNKEEIMVLIRRKSKVTAPPTGCPLAVCMNFMAGAWTINIIWFLSESPRRFSELKDDITGISAKVLTTRLKKLEIEGVIIRKVINSSPPTVEYSLTDIGEEIKPVLDAIVNVGIRIKDRKSNL